MHYGKRALGYVRPLGRHVTKRHKKPVRRLANKAVDWFEKITGFGDYHVSGNTLMTDNAPPMFQSSGQGVRLSHREYIGDIISSEDFSLQSYDINPGQEGTFPWLSSIAKHFEQYAFNGLIFEFRSTAGDAIASTNNALGLVVMATDYDVLDATYADKQEMQQSMFCCSGPPSRNLTHPIECDPSTLPLNNLYVRSGDESGTRDLRFQDMGKFQVATQGQQLAGVNVGELWVSYDVTFFKTQSPPDELFSDCVAYDIVSGLDVNNPFGTSPSLVTGSLLGFIISSDGVGNGVISFPPGYENTTWQFEFHCFGSGTGSWGGASASYTNGSTQNAGSSGQTVLQNQSATTNRAMFIDKFRTDATGQCSISFSFFGGLPSSLTTANLKLIRVQNSLSF